MSTTETDSATGDAPLLRDFDGMARNALKAQVRSDLVGRNGGKRKREHLFLYIISTSDEIPRVSY